MQYSIIDVSKVLHDLDASTVLRAVLQMWMSARTRGCAPGVTVRTPRAPSSVAVTPASGRPPPGTTVMVGHTQTHACTRIHAHTRMHTHVCTSAHAHVRTPVHTQINTHAHIPESPFVACGARCVIYLIQDISD